MISASSPPPLRRGAVAVGGVATLSALLMSVLLLTVGGSPSVAAATAVDLGTAQSFGVLAGQTVTNIGPSVIAGDLGVNPGNAVSGFPPGTVLGTRHQGDEVALQAQSDLTTAYNVLAGQPSDVLITNDLADRTLTTGVYSAADGMGLTGQLTLDAQGNPSAVFVFQVGSTLITASNSSVLLTNGAQPCNVFWQVGSSATLGTDTSFIGNVLALTSITANTGATIDGRLLARNGSVTLDDNMITQSDCAAPTDTGDPDTETADTETADTETADTGTGGTENPGTELPGTELPGSELPGTENPGTEVPDSDVPDTEVPAVGNPNANESENQVSNTPTGFPDTGDGGSMDDSRPALLVAALLVLLMGGGLLLVRWRRTATN